MKFMICFIGVCSVIGTLLAMLPRSVAVHAVIREQQACKAVFEEQLKLSVQCGQLTKVSLQDGGVKYINSSLIKTP